MQSSDDIPGETPAAPAALVAEIWHHFGRPKVQM
jgi:hypothetical protein